MNSIEPSPHDSGTLLLQSPIRCYDEPSADGLAPRILTVLLGTGALPLGAYPLAFARRSRDAAQRFSNEPS